jgi:hypothetical protein
MDSPQPEARRTAFFHGVFSGVAVEFSVVLKIDTQPIRQRRPG